MFRDWPVSPPDLFPWLENLLHFYNLTYIYVLHLCTLFQWIRLELPAAASSFPEATLIWMILSQYSFPSPCFSSSISSFLWFWEWFSLSSQPSRDNKSPDFFFLFFPPVKHRPVLLLLLLQGHSVIWERMKGVLKWGLWCCYSLLTSFPPKTAARWTQKPSQLTDTLAQPLFALSTASPLGGNQAQEAQTCRNRWLNL